MLPSLVWMISIHLAGGTFFTTGNDLQGFVTLQLEWAYIFSTFCNNGVFKQYFSLNKYKVYVFNRGLYRFKTTYTSIVWEWSFSHLSQRRRRSLTLPLISLMVWRNMIVHCLLYYELLSTVWYCVLNRWGHSGELFHLKCLGLSLLYVVLCCHL